MAVLLDTSGGVIGGGDVSGVAVAPGLSDADRQVLSTLVTVWGNALDAIYAALDVSDQPQVRYTEAHVDDAPTVAPTADTVRGWMGGSGKPTTPLSDVVRELGMLGALVSASPGGNGAAVATVRHHVPAATTGPGPQTWLLVAAARTVDLAGSEVGISGVAALHYLGMLLVGVPLTPQEAPRSAPTGPPTVPGLDVTWVTAPG